MSQTFNERPMRILAAGCKTEKESIADEILAGMRGNITFARELCASLTIFSDSILGAIPPARDSDPMTQSERSDGNRPFASVAQDLNQVMKVVLSDLDEALLRVKEFI